MPFFSNGSSPRPAGKLLFRLLYLSSLIFSFNLCARSQPDSLPQGQALNNLRSVYLSRIGESSILYNGIQYIRNGQKTEGFPFFESADPLGGIIFTGGLPHPAGKLMLDLSTGQLLTNNVTGTSLFVVQPSLVDSFILDGHLFLPLAQEKSLPGMRAGFYECIRAGNFVLFIHREKVLEPQPDYALSAYKSYDLVFLVGQGIAHPITDRRKLLEMLSDKNGDLKRFTRSEKLNFKKDLADASAATFRRYQNLIR